VFANGTTILNVLPPAGVLDVQHFNYELMSFLTSFFQADSPLTQAECYLGVHDT
jgi:hypothetical protein